MRGDARAALPRSGSLGGHAGSGTTATGESAKTAPHALDLRDRWPLRWQYLLAIGLIALALGVRWMLAPVLGDRLPFFTVFVTVMPLLLIVRSGPFLAATTLAVLGVMYLFVEPRFTLLPGPQEWLSASLFMLAAVVASVTAWLVGRARDRLSWQRFRAEQAVRDSEAEHRALFEAAAVGNVEVELTTGRFLRVNRKFCELTGYGAAELLGGMAFPEITYVGDRASNMAGFARFARGETSEYRVEKRYVRKDGAVIWVHVECTLLRDADGRPVRSLGVVQDITDRKRAEDERTALLESERAARAEAEQASRVKDEFMSMLSHELRTPINAVLGWAQLMRRGAVQGEELERAVEIIERNARLQAQLIADLLDMSRIVAGQVELVIEPVDLARVVENAIETVDHLAAAKGVRLERAVDPHVEKVRGDAARLEQVVWNLLMNAIKFTPSGGTVRVILAQVDACAEITVRDTGRGIEPEFLPRIFDRFSQADSSTTRRAGGLGLGLAISKQLVELHGGTLRAESAGLGHGASFVVGLPIAGPEAPEGACHDTLVPFRAGAASQQGTSLTDMRVLVVEDDPDSRAMVKRVLEEHGASVVAAASVAEALAVLDRDPPDIVVSDIGMPEEDGFDLIRQLRARPAALGGELPAVALTAYARPDDRARVLAVGYQAHVPKPVGADELVALLRRLADLSSAPEHESVSEATQ